MAAKKPATPKAGGGKKRNTVPGQAIMSLDRQVKHPKQYPGAPPNTQQPRISPITPTPINNRHSNFADPNSGGLHGTFNSGQPPQQSPYGAPQDPNYYASHPSPHSAASASGHYPASGPMATHIQRPPMYHTPQSNASASVAPQTHDQHGRSMYGQPPMYGYPPHYSQMPYPPHPHPPPHQHPMPLQSMMQHPNATIPQQQPIGQPGGVASSSPRLRVDPMQQQQQQQQQQSQPPQPPPPPQPQQPTPRMMHPHAPPQTSSIAATNVNMGQPQTPSINPSAAPGPIPATTPLVVRQDGNGVQWIAFEYSRDRVKSEYTIRCDVESVNVDSLSAEFKTDNCVYPRACGGKENYKGNRLIYETECNAVGWALAELNTCLRGKRGLIQRAVDSWRNSNQDPRLRSRRVRRQAKVQQRSKNAHQTTQLRAPSPNRVAGVAVATAGMGTVGIRAPGVPMGSMAAPQHQHHHHEMPASGPQDSNAEGGYSSASASASASAPPPPPPPPPRQMPAQDHPNSTPTDLRPAQVFAGYPAYPSTSAGASSQAPSSYSAMEAVGRPGGAGAMVSAPTTDARHTQSALANSMPPESRKRKADEVDGQQHDDRARPGLQFKHEGANISPSPYRAYSEISRSSYAPQMPAPAMAGHLSQVSPGERDSLSTVVRTVVRTETPEQPEDHSAPYSVDRVRGKDGSAHARRPVRHLGRDIGSRLGRLQRIPN